MKNTIDMKIILLLTASSMLFTSCGLPKASIEQKELFTGTDKGTLLWAQYDATRRGSMIFVDSNNKIRVLAENPPDVAMQSITELSTKIKVIDKVDIALALKTQQAIAELGKRTASVNMLRDALYRINEIYYSSQSEKLEQIEKLEIFKSSNKNLNSFLKSTSLFKPTLSADSIPMLFKLVINNAKEIAIKEASASISIEESKSKAIIKELKLKQLKIELLNKIFTKGIDSLSIKEKKLYDQILKL